MKKKFNEKLFTKKKINNTISKNCRPSEVNYKIYKRRSEVYMENEELLNEVVEKLNFVEKIFFKRKFIEMYKKGLRKGFNWSNNIVR